MLMDKEVIKKLKIKEHMVLKKFKSKKNNVYLLECEDFQGKRNYYVLKQYNSLNINTEGMQKEIKFLVELRKKGIRVPDIYYIGKDFILMKFIEGQTLADFIEIKEKNINSEHNILQQVIERFYELFYYLEDFYEHSQYITDKNIIFGDVNLRNFIINDKIYGIDFENCHIGFKEKDAGRICAFILTYEPCFTDFKIKLVRKLYRILIEEFKYEKNKLIVELKKELIAIRERRNLDIPLEKLIDDLIM